MTQKRSSSGTVAASVLELIGGTPLVRSTAARSPRAPPCSPRWSRSIPAAASRTASPSRWSTTPSAGACLKPGATVVEPTSGNTGIGPRDGGRRAGLPAHPDHARRHERGAPAPARALRRRDPPHAGHRGHDGRRVRRPGAVPRARGVLHAACSSRTRPIPRCTGGRRRSRSSTRRTGGSTRSWPASAPGGTLTGVGEVLKERVPGGADRRRSSRRARPCCRGGAFGPTASRASAPRSCPACSTGRSSTEIVLVRDEDATATARRLAREEGLLVGISAGAAVWAACQVAARAAAGPARGHGAARHWRALPEPRVLSAAHVTAQPRAERWRHERTVYIPTPFRRATNNRDRVERRARRTSRRCSTSWRTSFGGAQGARARRPRRGAPPREHLRQQRGASSRCKVWRRRSRTATRSRSSPRSPAGRGSA